MVCYAVPAAAAIIHGIIKRKNPEWKNNEKQRWLSLLLTGGSIFGIVDHLWNGELFLIGKNIFSDIALGFAITLSIFAVWGIYAALHKQELEQETKHAKTA